MALKNLFFKFSLKKKKKKERERKVIFFSVDQRRSKESISLNFFLKRHWQFYLIALLLLLFYVVCRGRPSGVYGFLDERESHIYLRQTWEWGCNGPSCHRDTRPSCRRPPPGSQRIAPARRNDVVDAHRRPLQPLLLRPLHLKMLEKQKKKKKVQ